MTRHKHGHHPPTKAGAGGKSVPAGEVFRRFFDLIERFERPKRIETKSAPHPRVRITRLDEDAPRKR